MALRDKINEEKTNRNQETIEKIDTVNGNVAKVIHNQKILQRNQIEIKEILEKQNERINKMDQNLSSSQNKKENNKDKNELLKTILNYTNYFLYLAIMVIVLFILGRVLSIGLWQGLGLQSLWGLGEWYWQALTIGIIALVIGAMVYVLYRGVKEIIDYGF